MAYPISEIQGIGTDVAAVLKSDGIAKRVYQGRNLSKNRLLRLRQKTALTLQLCWNVLYQQAGAWRNTYGRNRLNA